MTTDTDSKISDHHLQRKALIYVRQSTMKQVRENTASTARQYELVDTATALGWRKDLISVIDEDLGKSASSAAHRHGFQKLVAEVALGQVGIVMGLEISRLARNNADFQQLLQLCGANNTLIYDADALERRTGVDSAWQWRFLPRTVFILSVFNWSRLKPAQIAKTSTSGSEGFLKGASDPKPLEVLELLTHSSSLMTL